MEREAAMVAAFQSGQTLKAIGATWRVSRERVRQILAPLLTPDERRSIRMARLLGRVSQRQATRAKFYADRPVPCAVCRTAITRGQPWKWKHPTCSPRCAAAISMARWRISEELRDERRLANAQSILRHAAHRTATQIRWAQRALAGTARQRTLGGSRSSRATAIAEEFGFDRAPTVPSGLDTKAEQP